MPRPTNAEPGTLVQAWVPVSLRAEIDSIKQIEGRSASAIVKDAIEMYLMVRRELPEDPPHRSRSAAYVNVMIAWRRILERRDAAGDLTPEMASALGKFRQADRQNAPVTPLPPSN